MVVTSGDDVYIQQLNGTSDQALAEILGAAAQTTIEACSPGRLGQAVAHAPEVPARE